MAKLKPFTMPKWGIEMTEGTIAEWKVAENAPFEKGTVLTLIETDKITNEVEAEAPGRFVRLIAEAEQTYPVGALLAVLSEDGEASAEEVDAFIAAFRPADAGDVTEEEAPVEQVQTAPSEAQKPAMDVPEGLAISPVALTKAQEAGVDLTAIKGSGANGRITAQDIDQAVRTEARPNLVGQLDPVPEGKYFATPVARRVAVQHDVSLEGIEGSGAYGRIRKADVMAHVRGKSEPSDEASVTSVASPSSQSGGEVEIKPMSAMRRTIARRLTEAKQTIPHFYVRRRVRADRLLAHRAASNGEKPTVNDYFIKACALALCEVPQVNVQVHGNEIHTFASADISVAVATERGLVTPIVTAADNRSLVDIKQTMAALAQKAKSGKLRPEEFTGGSFSLSNLGGFGVEQFDAIINPPQGAILAVGAARPEPIEDDGAIRIVPVFHLALSCDHRAIDGADGARFMAALANLLERPELL